MLLHFDPAGFLSLQTPLGFVFILTSVQKLYLINIFISAKGQDINLHHLVYKLCI